MRHKFKLAKIEPGGHLEKPDFRRYVGMAEDLNLDSFWTQKLQEIEGFIVSGKHDQARKTLKAFTIKSIPRKWAAPLSQLALRFRDSLHALKILHPIIHPENRFNTPASVQERVAYAYALTNLGAIDEALEMLSQVDPKTEPEVLFQKAMAYFKNWNYQEASTLLAEFVACKEITDYRRLVGKINLASAHVCLENWQDARPLLEEIQTICEKNNYSFLLGNCYELKSQVCIFNQEYEMAFDCLKKSLSCLQGETGIYHLLSKKWEAISLCYSSLSDLSLKKLKEVRKLSLELSHWETLRECDLFEARFTGNEELFRKVIMGSPSEFYRQRARTLFSQNIRSAGNYHLLLSAPSPSNAAPMQFNPYKKDASGNGLYELPYLLYLYEALTQDFYKPAHLGFLFKCIYPEEKFNPYTSPSRVLRLLKRLDRWFQHANVPVRVRFKTSEFQLVGLAPVEILIHRGQEKSPVTAHLAELKAHFCDRSFSSAQAAEFWGISKTKSLKLLRDAFTNGKLKHIGHGRETRYQFARKKKLIERAA